MRHVRYIAAITILVLLIGFAAPVPACGPELWSPVFGNANGLDLAETDFVAGHLGVLHTDMSRRDEVAAYRILANLPLSAAAQAALTAAPAGDSWQTAPSVAAWQQATGQDLGGSPGENNFNVSAPGIYRSAAMGHLSPAIFGGMFLNCPADAFRAALEALLARKLRYRDQPQQLQQWIAAQETVFSNCGGPPAPPGRPPWEASNAVYPPQIPTPLPAEAPAAARADRAYQIAAAMFYGGEYPQAAQAFTAIAADAASPWHVSAPYLAARAMVREATVEPDLPQLQYGLPQAQALQQQKLRDDTRKLWLSRAEQQVDAVLHNPAERDWWHAASGLRGFIELRLHPKQRESVLGRQLMSPRDPTLAQDAIDLNYLLGQNSDSYTIHAPSANDLADWVQTFADGAGVNEWAYRHDVERWQATRSLPWLVAALVAARRPAPYMASLPRPVAMGLWPQLDELLAAARQIPATSPAYPTLRFELVRIEADRGHAAQAYPAAAAVNVNAMPTDLSNEFKAEAFRTAPTLADALAAAPRTTLDGATVGFDYDSLAYFNGAAGVAGLAAAAATPNVLPPALRDELVTAAWTRAALLDDTAVSRQLTPALTVLLPQAAGSLAAYNAAATPPERRFDLAWILLHYPGLSPYVDLRADYDGDHDIPLDKLVEEGGFNWWSSGDFIGYQQQAQRYIMGANDGLNDLYGSSDFNNLLPPFAQSPLGRNQWDMQRIRNLGIAPDILCRWVLEWVAVHPDDARAAEALGLAIQAAGHHGGDDLTAELSQACFDLLKSRYAATTWAAKTSKAYSGICGKMGEACP